ncbi:hypothetical protein ILYODFUR_028223, partial [Ilyodon furcidens]
IYFLFFQDERGDWLDSRQVSRRPLGGEEQLTDQRKFTLAFFISLQQMAYCPPTSPHLGLNPKMLNLLPVPAIPATQSPSASAGGLHSFGPIYRPTGSDQSQNRQEVTNSSQL